MEDLLVGGVRRGSNLELGLISVLTKAGPDVFDMANNDIGALALEISVLSTPDGTNVRGDASVDDDIFLTCVAIHVQPTEDKETVTKVQFTRQATELIMKSR